MDDGVDASEEVDGVDASEEPMDGVDASEEMDGVDASVDASEVEATVVELMNVAVLLEEVGVVRDGVKAWAPDRMHRRETMVVLMVEFLSIG